MSTCRVLTAMKWPPVEIYGVAFFLTYGLLLTNAVAQSTPPRCHTATSHGGMVVSASAPASLAGVEILREGGSAVDATVAIAFALAVTWPEAGNIGGGGFMMVQPVNGEPVCIDYREVAPRSADRFMFQPGDSTYTHQAVGVPGTVRGMAVAHARYGRLPWKRLLQPAIRLASEGFDVDAHLARSLNGVLSMREVQQDARFEELMRVYGHPEGRPWKAGDRLVQPDLAKSLSAIAEQGPAAFYVGQIAERIVAEMQRGRGFVSAADLRAYEAVTRTPVRTTFRQYEILGPPPPSSGGICLGLMLRMLETLDLRRHERYSPVAIHLQAEVMRRAYLERARYLGDPAFTPIPRFLFEPDYARKLAATISLDHASSSLALAPELPIADEPPNTTHFSVIDADGMAVSNTYTLEASFGSRIVVRGAGFLLNNEMGDFNWFPGVTDRSGRIGTLPNVVAPSKRMLSSQTPVIVLHDGRPCLLAGSPGGRTIINTVLTILVNTLEYEMELPEAVQGPRIHHQWLPDQLVMESGDVITPELVSALRGMGHQVVVRSQPQGSAHCIWIDPHSGKRLGVADWRRGGFAAGADRMEDDGRKR